MGRLAPVTAQGSWDVRVPARAVAIVMRTGNVVNEGGAIVAFVSTAVDITVYTAATVASIATGASAPITLECVAGVRCLQAINARSRLRFRVSAVQ